MLDLKQYEFFKYPNWKKSLFIRTNFSLIEQHKYNICYFWKPLFLQIHGDVSIDCLIELF